RRQGLVHRPRRGGAHVGAARGGDRVRLLRHAFAPRNDPRDGPREIRRAAARGDVHRERRVIASRAADVLARYGLVIVTLIVILAFSLLKPSTYFTTTNFEVIATNQAPTLLLSLAIMLPLISGEFDLSVAAIFGF